MLVYSGEAIQPVNSWLLIVIIVVVGACFALAAFWKGPK